VAVDALSVLSVNGDIIGVSAELSARMEACAFNDAHAVGRALLQARGAGPLRIGVPFHFSMHAELVTYWLESLGAEAERDFSLHTVPPPRMAEALAAREIDAFCVGEPWGSVAVENGAASLVLPGNAIWAFAPEKVLAGRRDWIEAHPDTSAAVMRALWRAARWLGTPENRLALSDILAQEPYLTVGPEVIDRAVYGRFVVNAAGREERVARFVEFFDAAATFPWRSQALWIGDRLARRHQLDPATAAAAARSCFRADLYRANLAGIGADLPGASEKVEGALTERTPVASTRGELYLGPDCFFDGLKFDL